MNEVELNSIAGWAGGGAVSLVMGTLWVSKVIKSWTADRGADNVVSSHDKLLTHYEERVELLAKTCDELSKQNSALMEDNAKLRGEMSQLSSQLNIFGELLLHYASIAKDSKIPPELLENLGKSMKEFRTSDHSKRQSDRYTKD